MPSSSSRCSALAAERFRALICPRGAPSRHIFTVVKVGVRQKQNGIYDFVDSPILPTGAFWELNVSGLCSVLMTPTQRVHSECRLGIFHRQCTCHRIQTALIMIAAPLARPRRMPDKSSRTLTMLRDLSAATSASQLLGNVREPASVVETKALKSSVVYSVKGFG